MIYELVLSDTPDRAFPHRKKYLLERINVPQIRQIMTDYMFDEHHIDAFIEKAFTWSIFDQEYKIVDDSSQFVACFENGYRAIIHMVDTRTTYYEWDGSSHVTALYSKGDHHDD